MVACVVSGGGGVSSGDVMAHGSPHHHVARPAVRSSASSGHGAGERRASSPAPSNHSFPFHLSGDVTVTQSAVVLLEHHRASSVVSSDQQSIYKQRIDAMFDETRSSLYGQAPASAKRENFVQAKIEKMFQEISTSSEDDEESNNNNNNNNNNSNNIVSSSSNSSNNSIEIKLEEESQAFNVHYLGNVPLMDKDTTLLNLQNPLKELYFKYRELELKKLKPALSKLEISTDGLKVIQGNRSELNPFSTIAVWAAVKCVSRSDGRKLAFLPLIADPDGQDKGALFTELNKENEVHLANGSHSPLLAVVMRQNGPTKQLRCHVYVCTCSEDAIVMAANLYQALMSNMKTKQQQQQQQNLPQVPKPEKPIRPPRKPKSKTSSETDEEILAEPQSQATYTANHPHQRRMSSSKAKDPTGDILTKIAIPRSRSFLMKHATRGGNSSLHDLFAEIRSQEGVSNMDEILEKIVNTNAKRAAVQRNSSSSSSCSSYHTLQRRGMRDRARKHKEAVETRLTSIANREIRRSNNTTTTNESKTTSESQTKRESSSGYVSCSECSLNSCMCDTDSCLDSDKCYCSLQNNKKHVVTSTSWRHHLNKPPSSHTSRSLQMLLEQPIIKKRPSSFTSRMDVYDQLPAGKLTANRISPKFNSVDNLALDYELFRYNSQQNSVYSSSSQHQRVLVVSARDNRGRLIYMGAQDKDKKKIRRDPANEALAVKKSAEIASLFSDMNLSQTTNIRGVEFEDEGNVEGEAEYNTLEPPQHPQPLSRRGSYPGSSLENSLGYLP